MPCLLFPHRPPKVTDSCSLELTCCTEHQFLPISAQCQQQFCHLFPCPWDTYWLLWELLSWWGWRPEGRHDCLPTRTTNIWNVNYVHPCFFPRTVGFTVSSCPHLPPTLPFFSRGGLRTRVIVRPLRSPFLPIATEQKGILLRCSSLLLWSCFL